MDEPGAWAFAWLVVAAAFGVGEMLMAGSFFMLPFAIGGVAASIASFAGVSVPVGWSVFIVTSIIVFLGLKPLANRLNNALPNPIGIGANRLVGGTGVVATEIPAGSSGLGMVLIGGEQWRAETSTGSGLGAGTEVRIIAVEGTRVIVETM